MACYISFRKILSVLFGWAARVPKMIIVIAMQLTDMHKNSNNLMQNINARSIRLP